MSHAGGAEHTHTNRLIDETSPYLLQHAHNPVDWHAWGEEAIERARRENKPIFLSVGYSTCYWCHVMERESFENEQVAAEMNRRFINIKVDREERPDVDQLYMTAVQVLTRHGGWPMSVFLSPDLRPFYGGTYFPPTDGYGRPGFVTLVRAIDAAYRERPEDVRKTGTQLQSILQQLAEPQPASEAVTIDRNLIHDVIWRSVSDYEPTHGGFGHAPKFPRETLLELLLVYLRDPSPPDEQVRIREQRSKIQQMLRHTLDAMADGGIRDHLGGGFHRYSTDAQWLVPHFEIMLYDNAMLAWIYVEAFRQTGEQRYAGIARGILDFVLREMTAPEGSFYTAFDAEVDAQEGLSYLWTKEEIESVLGGEDAKLFSRVYGVDRGPNFADPHHGTGRPDKNILFLPEPLEAVARKVNLTLAELEVRLEPMRRKLYEARRQRKQPLLDTKIITSWNALMIRAMAFAARVLKEPRYGEAASRAADYLMARHRTPDGGLWRTTRDGKPKYRAFLDDYAFLAQALLELDAMEGADRRREQANGIATEMIRRFHDGDGGAFYFTEAGASDILVRQKIAADSPLPSGNAVAAMAAIDLDRAAIARDTLSAFAGLLEAQGEGMSALVEAAHWYLKTNPPFTVAPGKAGAADRPLTPEQRGAGIVDLEAGWLTPQELHIRLNIERGYHINSNRVTRDLVSTHLTVGPEAMGDVAAIEYPEGEERRLAFNDAPLRVFDGAVSIVVRFKDSMAGRSPVQLALQYQACDEQSCLPPITKGFEVPSP